MTVHDTRSLIDVVLASAGVISTLLFVLIGGIWRILSQLSLLQERIRYLSEQQTAHLGRIERLETWGLKGHEL